MVVCLDLQLLRGGAEGRAEGFHFKAITDTEHNFTEQMSSSLRGFITESGVSLSGGTFLPCGVPGGGML